MKPVEWLHFAAFWFGMQPWRANQLQLLHELRKPFDTKLHYFDQHRLSAPRQEGVGGGLGWSGFQDGG